MNDSKDFFGWSFFVDTGGTFTDCLGLSPEREWFRAKVLSRGSISAEAVEQIDAKTLKISKTENLPKQFVRGFTLHISKLNHFSSKVLDWDPQKNELALEYINKKKEPPTEHEKFKNEQNKYEKYFKENL